MNKFRYQMHLVSEVSHVYKMTIFIILFFTIQSRNITVAQNTYFASRQAMNYVIYSRESGQCFFAIVDLPSINNK